MCFWSKFKRILIRLQYEFLHKEILYCSKYDRRKDFILSGCWTSDEAEITGLTTLLQPGLYIGLRDTPP